MNREDFISQFGMEPEKAKELMETLAHIVNREVRNVIEHADFYINPLDYGDGEEEWKEIYGEDALEKDEDSDGYPNLYDFKKDYLAESAFMQLISGHTKYGGMTSAIEACKLMDVKGWGR